MLIRTATGLPLRRADRLIAMRALNADRPPRGRNRVGKHQKMPVAGRRNDPPAERRQLALDPLAMRRQHLLDERLVALGIAVARHLALEIHRADDVRKQKRLQLGHTRSVVLSSAIGSRLLSSSAHCNSPVDCPSRC